MLVLFKEFVKTTVGSKCITVTLIASFLLFVAIPISQIAIGAVFLDDCAAERLIPIYLIVMGCFSLARAILYIIDCCRQREGEENQKNSCVTFLVSVIDCFLFAWFISGCVFIYRTKDNFQSEDSSKSDYCDHTLYWYAFWVTTATYIMIGVIILILVFFLCLMCCGLRTMQSAVENNIEAANEAQGEKKQLTGSQ